MGKIFKLALKLLYLQGKLLFLHIKYFFLYILKLYSHSAMHSPENIIIVLVGIVVFFMCLKIILSV